GEPRAIEAFVVIVGVDLDGDAGEGGVGDPAAGPRASDLEALAGRDAGVLELLPAARGELDRAADPPLGARAADRRAARVDQLDPQPRRRRRRRRQEVPGA